MKFRYLAAAASALMLVLAGASTATAQIDNNFNCELGDVTINGASALACAGSFTGNDITTVDEDGNIGLIQPPEFTASNPYYLTADDWNEGFAPDPIDGWLFGGKLDVGDDSPYTAGVLAEGSIVFDTTNGTFTVDVSPYVEVVLAFKQAREVAFYYFKNDGTGSSDLNWATGSAFDLSHLSVFVRGAREVPEPAAVALMGLGLLGLAFLRRRLFY